MGKRDIKLPNTIEERHGWITFPKFSRPIDAEGVSLWPERWPIEALLERKRQMGPIAWAQEMENNPIPEENSYFTLHDFEDCYDLDLEFEFQYRGHNPVFIGVDSQVNPDPKKSSDYGCIFVIEYLPSTESRRILWIERGKWGFRVSRLIREFDARYRPSKIIVENNQAQDYIIQDIKDDSAIPVQGFTTGGNKPDLFIGIPYLASTIKNQKWVIPRGGEREIELSDQWTKECLEYGQGHTGDTVMSSWFANDGARELAQIGMAYIPSVDNAVGKTRDFTEDHKGIGDAAQREFYSPAISRSLRDYSSSRVTLPIHTRSSPWRSDRGTSSGRPIRL